MSEKFLNLSGLSNFLNRLKNTFATKEQGEKAETAFSHAQSAHAPSNAERNIITGIQKNGNDISPNSNRKVNISIPTTVSELINYKLDMSPTVLYKNSDKGYDSTSITLKAFQQNGTSQTAYNGRFIIDVCYYGEYLTDGEYLLTDENGKLLLNSYNYLSELKRVYTSSKNESTCTYELKRGAIACVVCYLCASDSVNIILDKQILPVHTNNIWDCGANVSIQEINYLSGVSSPIQAQIDAKLSKDTTPAMIGAASINHNHSASNITSGIFSISNGGTGGSTAISARNNLKACNIILSNAEPTDQNSGDVWFMEV